MNFSIPERAKREVVGEIIIELFDPDGTEAKRTVSASVTLTDANGRPAGSWNGSLVQLLPQPILLNLVSFLNFVREEAEAKLLET